MQNRALTNECQIVFFEVAGHAPSACQRDASVPDERSTWMGRSRDVCQPGSFTTARLVRRTTSQMVRHIREMVYATRI